MAQRVGVYARFSSALQKDTSIDDQLRVCTLFAQKQGWAIDTDLVCTDYAASGASAVRAGLERLMGLVRRKAIDVLLVEASDRLSRDIGDSSRILKELAFYDVRLICVATGTDTQDKSSHQTLVFQSVMNEFALATLKEKTIRGLQGQAERGNHTGGTILGYRTQPIGDWRKPNGFRILVDDDQAALVRRIFSEYAEGRSLEAIAGRFNEEGLKGPRLSYWRKTTLREIVRNAKYIGEWSFGVREWRKVPGTKQRRYKVRPESEIQRSERPDLRIIDQATWEAVQNRLAGAAKKGMRAGAVVRTRTPKLLSGLLQCSLCKTVLTSNGSGYYRCGLAHAGGPCENRANIREDALLDALEQQLQHLLTTASLSEVIEQRVATRLKILEAKAPDQGRELEVQISKLGVEVERLLNFIMSVDSATAVTVKAKLTAKTSEKARLESELAALHAASEDPGPAVPTAAELIALASDISARLKQDPAVGRQMLYQLFGEQPLIVSPEENGAFSVRGSVMPWTLIMPKRAPKTRKPQHVLGAGVSWGLDGCADRI